MHGLDEEMGRAQEAERVQREFEPWWVRLRHKGARQAAFLGSRPDGLK